MNTHTDRQGLEFQIEMIEDAFDVHELDEETGERCCTADQPCTTRRGITAVHAAATAKLADLVGPGRTHTADEAKTTGRGGAATATRTVADPASEKQIGFIRSLADRTDLTKLTSVSRKNVAKVVAGETISRRVASTTITAMKAAPLADAPTGRPASEKQLGFLRSLITQKGYPVDEDKVAKLGARDASELIDILQKLPDADQLAPAAEGEALADGMYLMDGEVYKVQHAVHGSGRQYAKKLAGNATDGFAFAFAPGAVRKLTADHRMTLEDAAEFGKIYGTCCRCAAPLTDERSIERGYGPICAGKI